MLYYTMDFEILLLYQVCLLFILDTMNTVFDLVYMYNALVLHFGLLLLLVSRAFLRLTPKNRRYRVSFRGGLG